MSSERPFFSVVVPVYNKARLLDRSIKSILAQTFTDFEVVLVDDASTDESLSEIRKFSDPRIRLLHREAPGAGGYAARNLGIAESRGDWVAFLDADDEWYAEHLYVLKRLARDAPAGVVASGWLWDYGDGVLRPNSFSTVHSASMRKELGYAEFLHEAASKRMPMWTSAVAVRRELLQRVGGFPEQCRKGGDTVVWLRLLNVAEALIVSTRRTAVYHRGDSFVSATGHPEVRDNCVHNACMDLLREASDERIEKMLKRLSNIYVGHGILKRAQEGSLRFSDCNAHYFAVDWKDHILFRLHSLLPRRIQRGVKSALSTVKRATNRDSPCRGSTEL